MSEFSDLVRRLILEGENPNTLEGELEDAVNETGMWGRWNTHWEAICVCSKCGSRTPDICYDGGGSQFHCNQPGVTQIPYRDWLKTHLETGKI